MTDASCESENSNSPKSAPCLDWDEYFMAMAFLSAKRSKEPYTKVGACIVNSDKKIVAIGYNGLPKGYNYDEFIWKKGPLVDPLDHKRFYVCHAEVNAVLNKNSSDVNDCTMYVTLFPCNECAKVIIQSGIKTVIYMSDKFAHQNKTKAAKRMFIAADVEFRKYIPKENIMEIEIDFSK